MNKPKDILDYLKSKGHKNTAIRQAVIELLAKSSSPLSIPDLLLLLSNLNLKPNKTTVYREMDFLKNQSLIEEVAFKDGKKRYETSNIHHHHIVCIKCKTIKDISMEKDLNLEEQKIIRKMGFKSIGHSLEFFGLCGKCQ